MIPGIFLSNQGIVGDRVGDFASAILQVNPVGTAVLLALTSGMQREQARDTIFNWFEDIHQSMRTQFTSAAGALSTDVTLVVADGSLYVPNQILLIDATGEVVWVTAVNGNTLTVVRGMGGTTITAITTAMFAQGIGNAQPEAAAMPQAVTQQGSPRFNFTQIVRNAWAVSGTAKAVDFRTGSKLAKSKSDCASLHAEDIEKSLIWGVKHSSTVNGKPFRMTDGLVSQIKQYGGLVTPANSGSVAGQLSFNDFEDFMRVVFSKNIKGQPNERIVLAGDIAVSQFNKMARLDGTYDITKQETLFGIKIWTVISQFGELRFVTHPLMNENPTWQKELYVIHPGGIKKKVLRDAETEGYDTNGNRISGIDADHGLVTSELGLVVGGAQTMGIYSNVSKGIKST